MSLKGEFGTQLFKKLESYRQDFVLTRQIVLSLYQNSTSRFSCVGEYGTVQLPASLTAIVHCWLHWPPELQALNQQPHLDVLEEVCPRSMPTPSLFNIHILC